MSFRLWHLPVRAATGAYIVNSGLSKRDVAPEVAEGIHGFASSAYPQVSDVPPDRFVSGLSMAELAVGGVLLTPIIPSGLAGLVLTGFSSSLLGLYLKSPGLTEEGSVRPTQQGVPLAKDVWLLGIGLALVIDALSPSGRSRKKRKKKK
ncbi:MAG TPA: hypothetical protein VE395_02465 [Acidimicrobiales bacterium]|jgi:hypothetical protein|nr:hypothetical protein [Acidimicrobiales bacterium]